MKTKKEVQLTIRLKKAWKEMNGLWKQAERIDTRAETVGALIDDLEDQLGSLRHGR